MWSSLNLAVTSLHKIFHRLKKAGLLTGFFYFALMNILLHRIFFKPFPSLSNDSQMNLGLPIT